MSFWLFGCNNQPVGNTLLSSANSNTAIDENTSVPDDGQLDIQPDNAAVIVNMDNSDRAEITGTCKDLDRKKNRILVEVFAGEDETVDPYISNALSDKCQNTSSDLPTTDKCFWVTKGIGLVEDAGLPTEKSFPQCHNGRFGFSVKLGKILVPPVAGANLKYTVRFKLRTLDGILSDTTFSRVTVDRGLNVPVIDLTQYTSSITPLRRLSCNIKTSPARFNFGILYTLTRTFTDAANTVNAPVVVFTGMDTFSTVEGTSVFSFDDFSVPGSAFKMLQGVTYNYTLTSTENNFSYVLTPPTPTSVSNIATCTSVAVGLNPVPPPPSAATCFTQIAAGQINPNFGVTTLEWGYQTSSTWRGPNLDAQTGFISANCSGTPSTTACTETGLAAGPTYFFAVREKGPDGQISKWSTDLFSCKPL